MFTVLTKVEREKEKYKKKKEKERKRDIKYWAALARKEKEEREELMKKQKEYALNAQAFIEYMAETYKNNYNLYLVGYDIANLDPYGVISSLRKEKVTMAEVEFIFSLAEKMIPGIPFSMEFVEVFASYS